MDGGKEPHEDHKSFDPAAAFVLRRQNVAAFSVASLNSEQDERELIRNACAEAKRHVHQHKLGKKEKGALANQVLSDGHSFAARLAAVLQNGNGLPTMKIEYRNVSVVADALLGADRTSTVWTTTKNLFKRLTLRRPQTRPLAILCGVSGVILPGRLTLLLGPPGAGKSVLLQVLSGRLRARKGLRISGSVKYNGVELDEFVVRRTAGLVDQYDNHIPNMTVIETVNFAAACQIAEAAAAMTLVTVDRAISKRALSQAATGQIKEQRSGLKRNEQDAPAQGHGSAVLAAAEEGQGIASVGGDEANNREGEGAAMKKAAAAAAADRAADEELRFLETLREAVTHRIKPYITLRLVGLGHVADTMVGSETLRGVSGGERKPVTTAEVLVGPQWAVLMDEISTGLDSATAYSIIQMLRNSCHELQRTFLVSLLQPPPEVMQIFDDLLIITDGKVLFHGPVEQALPFFATLGFACPPRKDPASFLQEVTSPLGQLTYAAPELLNERGVPAQLRDPARLLTKPPTKLLVPLDAIADAFWQKSEAGRAMRALLDDAPFDPATGHPQALAREKYAKPWTQLSWLALQRQMLLTKRDKAYYIARVVQTVVMALVISSLFRLITPDDGFAGGRKALALSTLSAIYLSMSNMPVLRFVFATKQVFYKHRDNHFFPPFSYVVALALMQVPTSLLESVLYSLIVYWVAGLTPSAGRFFIFLVTCFSASNVLSAYFRLIAFLLPSMVVANAFGAMTLLIMQLTNGFTIVRTSMPPYLIWIYWALNPLAYAIRGLAINELTAPRWNVAGDPVSGDALLESFGFFTDTVWIWIGIAYCWAYLLVLTFVGALALTYTNPPPPQPTVSVEERKESLTRGLIGRLKRAEGSVSGAGRPRSPSADSAERCEAAWAATPAPVATAELRPSEGEEVDVLAVPFTPITLVCRDLCYYVSDLVGPPRGWWIPPLPIEKLPADFFVEPGRQTALVGGTGAGKTTLMDVVAGRKTQGIIRGRVLVNGHPKQQESWSRVVGYVEQMDIHSSCVTVQESLQFSARLRLEEASVSNAQVAAFVRQTLATVELSPLANSLVGECGGDGLSFEQRKRLSIAVELVANPSVLFMDEPTSGLDARAAAVVMRAVRNVADLGRTVVVTIHKLSMEIFEAFDMLVLMQSGRLSFFGPLGFESAHLISYLEAQPGVEPIKPGYNPATWMLEVTGGSMATSFQAAALDFPQVYHDSPERAANVKRMEDLAAAGATEALSLSVGGRYATSIRTQTAQLVRKYFSYYWHASSYSFVRIIMTVAIALIFGLVYLNQAKSVRPGSPPVGIDTVQNVMGLLFSMTIFLGMFNCMTVMPLVAAERVVYYRERAASMYSPWPYAMAQGVAELPYLAAQAVIMVSVGYWMVGFAAEAWKFFYFMLMFFLSITVYTFMGQFLVLATPNQLIAQLLAAAMNQIFSYFNGFLVPYPEVPAGWQWMARASPTTWIIYGLATTQLGGSPVCFNPVSSSAASPPPTAPALPGPESACTITVGEFVQAYFGYDTGMAWWCILIVLAYATFFRMSAVLILRYISYQKQ